MPIITKIKPQRNKGRVNIFLDGDYGFGLDLENFIKLNLKVEQELTEAEIIKILKRGEFKKLYDKIIRFATLRPRSRKEIERWFNKHKVYKNIRVELVKKLEKLELVGDEEFAKWWIEQRLAFKPRGKKALFSELMMKGVDRKTIENALSKTELNESDNAKKLLEKKSYKWRRYKGWDKRKKMRDFLARKGFSWDVIKEAVDSVIG